MNRKIKQDSSRKRTALLFYLGILLLFIWGNSLLSPKASWALSGIVQRTVGHLKPIAEADAILGQVEGYSVRKLAHLGEFAMLGILLMALTEAKPRQVRLPVVLSLGSLAALIDEGIQSFTGRTSCLRDVGIDLAGFCIGLMLFSLVALCFARKDQTGFGGPSSQGEHCRTDESSEQ